MAPGVQATPSSSDKTTRRKSLTKTVFDKNLDYICKFYNVEEVESVSSEALSSSKEVKSVGKAVKSKDYRSKRV